MCIYGLVTRQREWKVSFASRLVMSKERVSDVHFPNLHSHSLAFSTSFRSYYFLLDHDPIGESSRATFLAKDITATLIR